VWARGEMMDEDEEEGQVKVSANAWVADKGMLSFYFARYVAWAQVANPLP
jgi:hypothetical protein